MCRSPPPPPPATLSWLAQNFSAGAALVRHFPPPPPQANTLAPPLSEPICKHLSCIFFLLEAIESTQFNFVNNVRQQEQQKSYLPASYVFNNR